MTTENVEMLAEVEAPSNPFPGLRPFEFHESHLFFGRDGQSEELIQKLSARRFVAVVGTSGSGKSSLARAGLLPALFGGFVMGAGSNWRVAIMRPGNDPIGNLARALSAPDALGTDSKENAEIQPTNSVDTQDVASLQKGKESAELQTTITEVTLRRGSLGLVEAIRQSSLPSQQNLLVLVDQFEEIFRFAEVSKDEQYQNDATAFVKLLLEATGQKEIPIYVVLTMRSDYLGDCALFWGLPEAINESQYLIPRLSRNQRREAIEGPVAVGGAEITPRLVNRLLNDMGDNPDQLPILQHTLMRTWYKWKEDHRDSEPIDLRHYEAIGGMSEALSLHADEAYNELPDERSKEIAEKLFKGLTEKGTDNREIRRPIELKEICALVEAEEKDVIAVIETFRRESRSFLMPPAGVPLVGEWLIDISHESLIRNWKKLKRWVDEEAESVRIYKRLGETATLHKKGEAGLWRDPDLQLTLNWWEKNKPNRAWARRYHPGFDDAETFLKDSLREREKEERQRKRRLMLVYIFAAIFLALSVISALLGIKAQEQRKYAEESGRQNLQLLYASNLNLAQQAHDSGNMGRAVELIDGILNNKGLKSLRSYAWYYLWRNYHDELATLTGHSNSVLSVAFSPDGKTLATGSADNTVKLWDTTSHQELATLTGHSAYVLSVAFSPDGKTLATGSADNTVKLWDTTTHQELATLTGHSAYVYSVAFSPDGKTLATGSTDNTVKLWDTTTHQELATLTGHSAYVSSVAFSPDGKTLATGSTDNTVKLWDTTTHQELATLTGHSAYVSSVAFSPDGKTLATGSKDNTVKLWYAATEEEVMAQQKQADLP